MADTLRHHPHGLDRAECEIERLAARLNLIVDVGAEAAARAIGDDLAVRTGLESVFLKWTPYPKLGAHSRLSVALFLPAGIEGPAVIDAVEAVAAQAVAPASLVTAYLNGFQQDDGALMYNRIFDARRDEFLIPGVLWMDIEIDTHPGSQNMLQRAMKR